MREFKYKLNDQEKILLSRIYKLDKQIETYIKNHKNEDMNKLIPKTDFIKKSNELYKLNNTNYDEYTSLMIDSFNLKSLENEINNYDRKNIELSKIIEITSIEVKDKSYMELEDLSNDINKENQIVNELHNNYLDLNTFVESIKKSFIF